MSQWWEILEARANLPDPQGSSRQVCDPDPPAVPKDPPARGRAHLLFEMFHQGIIDSGWRSQAVQDSLDLCLSCKGGKQECPVNVDLATCKSEFRAHHYRFRLRPRVHYSMGFIATWGRLGSRAPHWANFLVRMPGLDLVAKQIAGIAPQRRILKFAPHTFLTWYEKNHEPSPVGRPQLVLFPDVFDNYFYPHTLDATYLLLVALAVLGHGS